MKIIAYNPNTKEWYDFVNSAAYSKAKNRDKMIDQYIEKTGIELTPKKFVENDYKYTGWGREYSVRFLGEPVTPVEKLICFIYDSPSYIHMSKSFPEDFVESRTNWDTMLDYADEMGNLIKEILGDLLSELKDKTA